MKKSLAIIIAALLVISVCFVACSKNKDKDKDVDGTSDSNAQTSTTGEGLLAPEFQDEYGFEKDKDGNDVLVKYEKDKNGKVSAYVVDENGKKTDVTVPASNYEKNESNNNSPSEIQTVPNVPTTDPKEIETVTNNTSDEKGTTNPELTTLPLEDVVVPKTTDKGKPVQFSNKDILAVQRMLEVPYLYTASYENSDGVPISIARHAALWMAANDGNQNTALPGGTTIINLFIYFDQTVSNFKTKCNNTAGDSHPAPIRYNPGNDIFTIMNYEEKTHSIEIEKIENLGNNNYYKVTASVKAENGSDCKMKKVVAIVQKNRLNQKYDSSFSVKALQWS